MAAKFENAVTAAAGFRAAGVHVGVKTSNKEKRDIALICSDRPCAAAGVFFRRVRFFSACASNHASIFSVASRRRGCSGFMTGKMCCSSSSPR